MSTPVEASGEDHKFKVVHRIKRNELEAQAKRERKRKQESPNVLTLAYSNYITYELIKERKSMKSPNHPYQSFTRFSKSLAERWKNMSSSEKVIFERAIYEDEEPQGGQVKKVKRTKKGKDPNAPKRVLAAFMRFQVEQRKNMKTDPSRPKNLAFTEIAKYLSEKWRNMSPEEKEPYETAAKIDQEKYRKDVAEYKSGQTAQA